METLSRKGQTKRNIALTLVILVGMLTIIFAILINLVFNLTMVQLVLSCWILTALYSIWAVVIVDPRINPNPVQLIKQEVIREVPIEVEKEVIRNVFIDRPVMVDREVIREVPIEVQKTVYRTIETPHQNLNIPRYKFLGSTQTRTYHKRTCKFSKLIKNKYKLHSNVTSTFKRQHYKSCKACINTKAR